MTNFILSKDQVQALEKMEAFLDDKSERVLVLAGYAGTGKTFILRQFIEYLDSINYNFTLCAPTHRAKFVLEELTGYQTDTLHHLLSMSPNVDIYHLNLKDLKFKSSGKSVIPSNGLVIVDECSMVSDDLYDLLIDYCAEVNTKIVFVGDRAQINPVGVEEKSSKVFDSPNIVSLTKLHRQQENNGLIPLLFELRKKYKPKFESTISDNGSLFVYENAKDFMVSSIPFFQKAMKEANPNEVKIVAYTNKRVKNLNDCVRRIVLGDNFENQYNKFEILTGYDNMEYNNSKIFNSVDYVVVGKPQKVNKKLPHSISIPGYTLNLYDKIYKNHFDVFVMDNELDEDYIEVLANDIESLRFDAISAKNLRKYSKATLLWKQYYQLTKSFATHKDIYFDNRVIKSKTFDYGYASTLHKIQGSSLNEVFVDMKDVLTCRNLDVLRQMQYVALSRTKNNAYILQ